MGNMREHDVVTAAKELISLAKHSTDDDDIASINMFVEEDPWDTALHILSFIPSLTTSTENLLKWFGEDPSRISYLSKAAERPWWSSRKKTVEFSPRSEESKKILIDAAILYWMDLLPEAAEMAIRKSGALERQQKAELEAAIIESGESPAAYILGFD